MNLMRAAGGSPSNGSGDLGGYGLMDYMDPQVACHFLSHSTSLGGKSNWIKLEYTGRVK